MKKKISHQQKLFLSLFFYLFFTSNTYSLTKHFIFIGVDGLSAAAVKEANLPHIKKLIQEGSSTLQARAILPTSSAANWSTILMGAAPGQTGVLSNDWDPNNYVLEPIVKTPAGIFPTIFSVLGNSDKKLSLSALYHWDGIEKLIEKEHMTRYEHHPHQEKVSKRAAELIMKEKPNFLFIHLDHVDDALHNSGHKSKKYTDAVKLADKLIGDIIESMVKARIYEDSIVLVSSDHGGRGKGHGGTSLEEIEIPWIIAGAGIKKGHKIKAPIYTFDTAATIAFVFGVQTPYEWVGRPVKSSFLGYSDPSYTYGLPIEKPLASEKGGLFLDKGLSLSLKGPETADIYYTLDGRNPASHGVLYQKPIKLSQDTILKAISKDASGRTSYTISEQYRFVSQKKPTPIVASYYEYKKGEVFPSSLKRLEVKKEFQTWDFSLNNLAIRGHHYALSMRSFLKIDKRGSYDFWTRSDDGSRLYLNDQLIVDNWETHGSIERHGRVFLEKGVHPIKVEYFQHGGGEELTVSYKGPKLSKQIISPSHLLSEMKQTITKTFDLK